MDGVEKIKEILESWSGGWGITEAQPVLGRMREEKRKKALEQMPGLSALLCCVLPYYAGEEEGNLSLYARGEDYHQVAGRYLEESCKQLEELFPGHTFRGYADISPYPEVYACARSGLGKIGQNGLLITPQWGSYVFCCLIACDLPLTGGKEPEPCRGCGLCRAACPGGALTEEGKLMESRCLSALTQSRGELSPWQEDLIARSKRIWGCDICQQVCPENKGVKTSYIAEFTENITKSIEKQDLEGLSDRAFRKKYAGKAFSFRGIKPLKRNLELKEKKE
ncbi:epoxyqueuosine reductase [Intestinimonas sp. MSJ-38]|uniref:epoxyqueuosine reductase n=1 Tax=Intestinimonas sp. MSJ-38 TaxID=2841532 RepID=UPI001C125A68|nr:QueG-associated DUF1730 domain-containing protein [Intestinimonas sp. MSJ-38]MBU5431852.1 DUF1730 domain-containing protein [Intestinimonas sp. MSJ-38]